MLTRNAYALMSGYLGLPIKKEDLTFVDDTHPSKDLKYVPISNDNQFLVTAIKTSIASGNAGIAVGTGITEESLDDHSLSGEMITGIVGGVEHVWDPQTNTLTKFVTIANNTESQINIGEIGLFGNFPYVEIDSSTTNLFSNILFERTVLESPISIASGRTGVIEYSIQFNIPE